MTTDKYNTTTITASAYNRKVSVELPDCDAFELFDAFRAVMVGLTYSPNAFNDAVVQYVDENNLLEDRTLKSDDLYNAETNLNVNTIQTQQTIIRRLNEKLDKVRSPDGPFTLHIARAMLTRDGIEEASENQWKEALVDARIACIDALNMVDREVNNG